MVDIENQSRHRESNFDGLPEFTLLLDTAISSF
jgi:hypothetical protein